MLPEATHISRGAIAPTTVLYQAVPGEPSRHRSFNKLVEHADWYLPETRYGGILLAVQLSQRRQIRHLHRSGRGAFVLRNHLQGILSGGLLHTSRNNRTQRVEVSNGTQGPNPNPTGFTTNFLRVVGLIGLVHANYHLWAP